MPDVVGVAGNDARNTLIDLGLHVTVKSVELPIGDSRDGLVVSQLPPAGTPVPPGTFATIQVGHLPDVVVPDVVGMDYGNPAQSVVEAAGLHVALNNDASFPDDGVIYEQDPPAGSLVPAGTTVTLTFHDSCFPGGCSPTTT